MSPIFEKNAINLNFLIGSFIQALFKIKIQSYMSEQEKKRQRIFDLLNAGTKLKFLCLASTKQRNFLTEKEPFKAKGKWRIEQKTKRCFNCSLNGY